MLLNGKNAVVYGAGGAVGSAVARAFAREGARVFLTGRTLKPLEALATELRDSGAQAEAARVDALDEDAVDAHAEQVVSSAGSLDVSFNGVGIDNGDQGVPLVEISADVFGTPIRDYTRTHFITARAAALRMMKQKSGVILPLSGPMARSAAAFSGSFGLAHAAIESLSRQLAAELGPHGIRVVCIRPTGMRETAEQLGSHVGQVWQRAAERLGLPFEELLTMVSSGSPLERALAVNEVAEVAAFMASDRASAMTATTANVTLGSVID
ncbi:SDR family NAD(P)-dependent oxidoreductase [Stackebrandtia nassauensis]|uniref:Short-chain dehydrogenase/reductase SDR n=1 Tax=Stackebrandtia nassauensis (strain DSM 44728 / CIP 108903 / NRRL B-16338 / NBRC 102104 / LLR-40K-21) TaxID=446470 RepID=D3PUG7_STANL|nr:SDR family oxidoreductase [Stackebrandtia nassauensis]ADD42980.1 short-chain dehydrogenase/reductase SDR [Stackebrandtia nassauensis DSM 44728]